MINIFDKLFPSYGGKVITDSKYIKDAVKNKNLEDVVKDIDNELARQQGEISALHSGNYITVTAEGGDTSVEDIMTREGITPAVDTIYRIGAWDGTQYDDTAYSEYSWNQDNGYKFIAAHKEKGIDTDPTADSHNLVESGGVQNELALGAVYDVSAKNPTSGPNNDGKWESLSALLSDANLNTLIPTSVRKGGMSIKFVQSSDNKYIQARCMAQNFTTETTQWAIEEEGVYVENPEFIYVNTDNEDKILWAIKKDGKFYFGAGCPPQVVEYITAKLEELEGDFTTLLNTKVDKVTGKSLIDSEFASSQEVITNPEYLQVTTDSEDKILEGIKTDGTKVIELPLEVQGVRQETIDNPEFIQVTTDSQDRILEGITSEGKKRVMVDTEYPNGIPTDIKKYVEGHLKDDNFLVSLNWEIGGINSSTGVPQFDSNKIRTADFLSKNGTINCPSGYQIYAVVYYSLIEGTFQRYTLVQSDTINIVSRNEKYKIIISNIDSSKAITVEEFANRESAISPYYKFTDFGKAIPFPKYKCLQQDYSFGEVGVTKVADVYAAFDTLVDNDFIYKRSIGIASNGVEQFIYYTNPTMAFPEYMPFKGENYIKKNPQFFIVGSIHGNEQAPVFGWYYLFKDLKENYMHDDVLRFIHQYVSIIYSPCSNPYGFDNVVYWNTNHVNLNRNWDVKNWIDPSGGDTESEQYAGPYAFSEAESTNLRDVIINEFPDIDVILDNHVRNRPGGTSEVESLIWIEMPRWDCVKDSFTALLYQACSYHLMNMTAQFHYDYEQYIGGNKKDLVGTLFTANTIQGVGQINAWASQNNFLSLTVEGFAGFPLDEAIDTNDLVKKANAESWANLIVTICKYLGLYK